MADAVVLLTCAIATLLFLYFFRNTNEAIKNVPVCREEKKTVIKESEIIRDERITGEEINDITTIDSPTVPEEPEPYLIETCGMRISLRGENQSEHTTIVDPSPEETDDDVDVTVDVGEKKITVKKTRLIYRSGYFRKRMNSKWIEGSSTVLKLPSFNLCDFDCYSIEQLLEFCQTSRLTLTKSNVQNLMNGAIFLQMESVMVECGRFMLQQARFDDLLSIRAFFHAIEYKGSNEKLERMIDANFIPISNTVEFPQLSKDDLCFFLQRDTLRVDAEEQVFEALSKWKGNTEDRRCHGARLLQFIRIPLLSSSFITEVVEKCEWVKNSDESRKLIGQAKGGLIPTSNLSERIFEDAPRLIVLIDTAEESLEEPADLSIFNPLTSTWTHGKTERTPDTIFNIAVVGEKAYFLDFLGRHEIYDTRTNKWTLVQHQYDRHGEAVGVIGNKIYAAGGETNNGDKLSSVVSFDTTTAAPVWAEVSRMNSRRFASMSCVNQGFFYVFHRGDVEVYDPVANTWTLMGSIPNPRRDQKGGAVAAFKGNIYFVGGNLSSGTEYKPIATCDEFNPMAGKWTKKADMIHKRNRPSLVVACGKMLVFGGFNENGEVVEVEEFEPEKNMWTIRAETNLPYQEPHVFAIPIPASVAVPQY